MILSKTIYLYFKIMSKIYVDVTVRTVIDSKRDNVNISDIVYNLDVNIATNQHEVKVGNFGVVGYDILDMEWIKKL